MKILYANQVFLDYRIPYYQKLIQLFKGNFYVMYSPNRYHLMKRDDLVERIKSEMGDNAVAFNHDYLFDTATMSFNRVEGEYGQKIPFMYGFLRAIKKIKPDVLITEAFFSGLHGVFSIICFFIYHSISDMSVLAIPNVIRVS